jgi:hypothetical protein
MSASLAPSAAPRNALRVWCDARYIYVELPTRDILAQPHIMTYPRTGRGFSDLLSLLYGSADNSSMMPENFKPDKKLVGTPIQHAQAAAILRQRGIIK